MNFSASSYLLFQKEKCEPMTFICFALQLALTSWKTFTLKPKKDANPTLLLYIPNSLLIIKTITKQGRGKTKVELYVSDCKL